MITVSGPSITTGDAASAAAGPAAPLGVVPVAGLAARLDLVLAARLAAPLGVVLAAGPAAPPGAVPGAAPPGAVPGAAPPGAVPGAAPASPISPAPSRASAPPSTGAGGVAAPVPAAGANWRRASSLGQPELVYVHAPRHKHDGTGETRCAQPQQGGDHGMPCAGGYGYKHGVSRSERALFLRIIQTYNRQ